MGKAVQIHFKPKAYFLIELIFNKSSMLQIFTPLADNASSSSPDSLISQLSKCVLVLKIEGLVPGLWLIF